MCRQRATLTVGQLSFLELGDAAMTAGVQREVRRQLQLFRMRCKVVTAFSDSEEAARSNLVIADWRGRWQLRRRNFRDGRRIRIKLTDLFLIAFPFEVASDLGFDRVVGAKVLRIFGKEAASNFLRLPF